MIFKLNKADRIRFWSFVKKGSADDCWEWQGGLSYGYGHFWLKGKTVKAHQVSFYLNGRRTKLLVLHSCNNRRCCNPKHLFDGTQSTNIKQAVSQGRMYQTFPIGDNHPNSKVRRADFPKIEKLLRSGLSQKKVGAIFGVNQQAICKIRKKIHA